MTGSLGGVMCWGGGLQEGWPASPGTGLVGSAVGMMGALPASGTWGHQAQLSSGPSPVSMFPRGLDSSTEQWRNSTFGSVF